MTTWFTEDPIPASEKYLEARYAQIAGGETLPIYTVVALMSLAFGTSNSKELLLASGGMLAQYYAGGDALDGIISVLSGVQLAKGKFRTMAFPALLESYKTFKDFTKGKTITKQTATRSAIFVTGWLAARYKYV